MDDYFDDMVDGGDDMEEMVTLMDSARPLKRSRSGDGADGDEMDDADAAGAGCEVWQRPPLPDINTETDTLLFQWMSIDVCGGEPLKANPARGRGVAGSKNGPVPILHVYGVTDAGNSVLCRIHGFTPYFYFHAPPGITRAHLPAIKAALENSVRWRVASGAFALVLCQHSRRFCKH